MPVNEIHPVCNFFKLPSQPSPHSPPPHSCIGELIFESRLKFQTYLTFQKLQSEGENFYIVSAVNRFNHFSQK